jgi:hypothetical protein
MIMGILQFLLTIFKSVIPHNGVRVLFLIMLGSLFFLGLKIVLVTIIDLIFGIEPWINYLIVTISITSLGWVYHSKASFGKRLSWATLKRYINQAILLKALDYCAYNSFVYILGGDIKIAVVFSSLIIFSSRVIIYIKYVFK